MAETEWTSPGIMVRLNEQSCPVFLYVRSKDGILMLYAYEARAKDRCTVMYCGESMLE